MSLLKNLLHMAIGPQNNPAVLAGGLGAAMGIGHTSKIPEGEQRFPGRLVFDGRVRVTHVSNGYVIEITKTGTYTAEVLIARDSKEVNDLIIAAMVSFRLEEKG